MSRRKRPKLPAEEGGREAGGLGDDRQEVDGEGLDVVGRRVVREAHAQDAVAERGRDAHRDNDAAGGAVGCASER